TLIDHIILRRHPSSSFFFTPPPPTDTYTLSLHDALPISAALIALNCNKPLYVEDYHAIGAAPYACHHCHTGRCPVGITTQDPERSEEHTSELQSLAYLVCRLLLEKKKKNIHKTPTSSTHN